ncbi:hypothetical protein QYM36_018147 [Artemia franciscana]|uniref:SCAN domain-containing protein 3 n=1 Tax=Artemia franciscana TaxID=6661 RepID=A0AA88H777_ARTSF|nr:hypothetical protein QYM36_018147 [Artemia franciscana]
MNEYCLDILVLSPFRATVEQSGSDRPARVKIVADLPFDKRYSSLSNSVEFSEDVSPLQVIEEPVTVKPLPLIELQSDEIMRAKFKDGKYNIRKTNDVATKYPLLWDKAQFYVIAFPTSYLVEAGFSRISQILSKARNRLDIVKRGDELSLTSIEPNIKNLVEKHQPQGSH